MWIKLWFFLSFVFFHKTIYSRYLKITEHFSGHRKFNWFQIICDFFPRISTDWFRFRKIHGRNREFFFMNPCFDGGFSWQISYIGKLYCAHKETHYACLTGYVWNISFVVNKNHALTKVVLCESCKMYWTGLVRCIKRDWSTELIDSYKESSAKQAVFRSTKALWKRLCIATIWNSLHSAHACNDLK